MGKVVEVKLAPGTSGAGKGKTRRSWQGPPPLFFIWKTHRIRLLLGLKLGLWLGFSVQLRVRVERVKVPRTP